MRTYALVALAVLIAAASTTHAQTALRLQGSGVASGSIMLPDGPFDVEVLLDLTVPPVFQALGDTTLYGSRGVLSATIDGTPLPLDGGDLAIVQRDDGTQSIEVGFGTANLLNTAFGTSLSVSFVPGTLSPALEVGELVGLTPAAYSGVPVILFGGIFIGEQPTSEQVGLSSLTFSAPEPPQFTQAITPPISQPGDTVVLTPAVASELAASYLWTKDGVPVVDGLGISGQGTPSLTLTASDATRGNYVLTATSLAGSSDSEIIPVGVFRSASAADFNSDGQADFFDVFDLISLLESLAP
ncbi:MAG: immunoglobulin domain-containing protein [Planctomycetota bacterium]